MKLLAKTLLLLIISICGYGQTNKNAADYLKVLKDRGQEPVTFVNNIKRI